VCPGDSSRVLREGLQRVHLSMPARVLLLWLAWIHPTRVDLGIGLWNNEDARTISNLLAAS